jgi:hypothetical protein
VTSYPLPAVCPLTPSSLCSVIHSHAPLHSIPPWPHGLRWWPASSALARQPRSTPVASTHGGTPAASTRGVDMRQWRPNHVDFAAATRPRRPVVATRLRRPAAAAWLYPRGVALRWWPSSTQAAAPLWPRLSLSVRYPPLLPSVSDVLATALCSPPFHLHCAPSPFSSLGHAACRGARGGRALYVRSAATGSVLLRSLMMPTAQAWHLAALPQGPRSRSGVDHLRTSLVSARIHVHGCRTTSFLLLRRSRDGYLHHAVQPSQPPSLHIAVGMLVRCIKKVASLKSCNLIIFHSIWFGSSIIA